MESELRDSDGPLAAAPAPPAAMLWDEAVPSGVGRLRGAERARADGEHQGSGERGEGMHLGAGGHSEQRRRRGAT